MLSMLPLHHAVASIIHYLKLMTLIMVHRLKKTSITVCRRKKTV